MVGACTQSMLMHETSDIQQYQKSGSTQRETFILKYVAQYGMIMLETLLISNASFDILV